MSPGTTHSQVFLQHERDTMPVLRLISLIISLFRAAQCNTGFWPITAAPVQCSSALCIREKELLVCVRWGFVCLFLFNFAAVVRQWDGAWMLVTGLFIKMQQNEDTDISYTRCRPYNMDVSFSSPSIHSPIHPSFIYLFISHFHVLQLLNATSTMTPAMCAGTSSTNRPLYVHQRKPSRDDREGLHWPVQPYFHWNDV